ncbi:hypothetical protein ISCGN_001909 [Ixodes scapularis]
MAQQLPKAETRLDREVQTAQESEEIKGIDSDFTDAELQTALFQLKRNTAPGPDKITYGMLRNIPDNKLDELLRHINEVWATGELPEEWKEAHVIMLPKPGKLPNTPANLRPISKTSCMGKLMEKMALNRLEWHLDATNQLAHTLVRFRRHVSTQDVAKMIKEQVYDNPSRIQQRTIVAVDIKRAFDNVTHKAILRNLRETNPGNRIYRYVKNFLKDRTQREWVRNRREAAVASTSTASTASNSLAKEEHIARLESCRREKNQRCKRRRRATDDDRAMEAKRKREARRRQRSTPAEQFPGATARFRREFVEDPFGVTCAVCDLLWFIGDVSMIGGVLDEKKRETGACALR